MHEAAPVDYAIIAFPGNRFSGKIIPAIGRLVENGTIRLLDVVFVGREVDGTIVSFDLTDIEGEDRDAYTGGGGAVEALFSDEDLAAVAEEIEPGSSGVLLVWENLWAREVAEAVRDADGVLLDFGRIPHAIVEAARAWAREQGGVA